MAVQIQGFSNVVQEVESASRAGRVVLRPVDYGSLGIYSLSLQSGVMAAGLAADASVFQFRWTHATNLALIKQIRVLGGGIAAFAAGHGKFDCMIARAFTASGSGGTAATLTGNNNKLRTSMATMGVADIRISSTAALTAGTWTLDAQPVAQQSFGVTATAGATLGHANALINTETDSEYPIVLAQNEGINIRATVPATGTWAFGVTIRWAELAAFAP